MASNIPPCIKCKNIPTFYRVQRDNDWCFLIKCFNCSRATSWCAREDAVLYAWGVDLGNNLTAVRSIRNCKRCLTMALLVVSRDDAGFVQYSVKCGSCRAATRFASKSSDSIIETWNRLHGVSNG